MKYLDDAGSVRNPRSMRIWCELEVQLLGQLWVHLDKQIRDRLGEQFRVQLWGQIGDQIGELLYAQLRGQSLGQLLGQLGEDFGT